MENYLFKKMTKGRFFGISSTLPNKIENVSILSRFAIFVVRKSYNRQKVQVTRVSCAFCYYILCFYRRTKSLNLRAAFWRFFQKTGLELTTYRFCSIRRPRLYNNFLQYLRTHIIINIEKGVIEDMRFLKKFTDWKVWLFIILPIVMIIAYIATGIYCQAIEALQLAMERYDPSTIGYAWDKTNPRIQLEPRGERGYIELRAVR